MATMFLGCRIEKSLLKLYSVLDFVVDDRSDNNNSDYDDDDDDRSDNNNNDDNENERSGIYPRMLF
jgi:hypothetical protein